MMLQNRCKDTGAVLSPCTKVCKISPATSLCLGCGRTLDEIAAWSRATDEYKLRVWARLESANKALVEN
ncbi:DUF1289 domain-containing protein [Undibacterium cyanobacteriorum]|uniref:DUF1289 domain-containing protein n=1 Tax=Undibacterium cyanobacteriorum TaxID=3073561 RepID=A0ABY9RJD7_9BURK|nr:DUF1289 domain-containing protein [Undibacterium sp. 20NA77.5]WMW80472.1 DUF1289 domain-containing protein [Undibacterium sp. 20NA77.5]